MLLAYHFLFRYGSAAGGSERLKPCQSLFRTFASHSPHCLIIIPFQMHRQFSVQCIHVPKVLPIVKISLIVSVTAFYFPVMPRRPRRYLLVGNPRRRECRFKRTAFPAAPRRLSAHGSAPLPLCTAPTLQALISSPTRFRRCSAVPAPGEATSR
jgi:hypothetical protein